MMSSDPDFKRLISAIRTHLCTRTPFFGALALFARVETSHRIPTAATDGRDIFINPDFFENLMLAEQEGLFLHEVLHAALLHVPRGRGRDGERWNIAADIVVNGILAKEGYALPAGAIRDLMLEQYSVEEVYDLLTQTPDRFCLNDLDLLSRRPGAPGGAINPELQRTLEDYWRNAREQASILAETTMYGSMPASMHRELGRLKATQLNWRHYLWRFLIHTPMDFSGFDRRFVGRRIYLDTLTGESVQVVVAVDTSGSIMDEQLQAFVAEVQGILGAYPHLVCNLYYIDTEAHGPYRLTPYSVIPSPVGGGGTDFRPFFECVARDYDTSTSLVGVYLTDGYGSFPDAAPTFPTLWVVTPGGLDSAYFPFGEVVRLVN